LLAVRARLVLGRHFLQVVHADDADIGAGWNGLEAVLDLTPANAPDPGAEAEEELGDLHAGPARHHEVAELVEEDDDDQGDHREGPPPRAEDAQGEQEGDHDPEGQERRRRLALRTGRRVLRHHAVMAIGRRQSAAGRAAVVDVGHRRAIRSMHSAATARACPSAAITASTSSGTEPSCRESTASRTSGISDQAIVAPRKAATDTSLAAL